jgi:predicted metal-dependent peptidase
MSAENEIDKAALREVVAQSGVSVTSAELDALAGSLERIKAAASILLRSISFDETPESFYRLLEGDGADEADR